MEPIPMRLPCPKCHELHIDEGEFATKPHHTHACQHCGEVWRPATVDTVGVRFLPGFKDETVTDWANVLRRIRDTRSSASLPYQLRVKCAEPRCIQDTNAPGCFGWTFCDGEWRCAEHSKTKPDNDARCFLVAWKEIERLIAVKAIHRKGFDVSEVQPLFIIGQAIGEFGEFIAEPESTEEFADLLGILFHYAIKMGWTPAKIEKVMLEKFRVRFTEK